MGDIKALLKEARKLIDEQKFEEAQEYCKNILRKDKQNYLGLVLLGKSLQDSNQAPLAFQKAIACKPDQLLAWQGLANYYEKQDKSDAILKLFDIYEEILKLQIVYEKAIEVMTKLSHLGSTHKNMKAIKIFLRYLNISQELKLKDFAEAQLINLLKCEIECDENDIPSILNVLQKHHNPTESELISARVIMSKIDQAAAVDEITNLSKSTAVREWLSMKLCNQFVENNFKFSFDVQNYFNRITEGIENSKEANLLKSIMLYENKQYLEAYKQCVTLIDYQKPDATTVIFLLKCAAMLKKWTIIQKLTVTFLAKRNDDNFTLALRKFLFLSLVKQKKWKEAVSLKELPVASMTFSEQACLAECYIQLGESCDDILNNIRSTEHYLSLKALKVFKENKYEEVVTLLERDTENPIHLNYLGRAFWHLKKHDKCQLFLLKSAKLDPDNADTFLYLGHYYKDYIQDLDKARKCYEKAHTLHSTDDEILKCLSKTYTKLNLNDKDFELLSSVEITNSISFWLQFRLGLHYLNRRDWEKAIICFRNVIKKNKLNSTAFECLADAYFCRGSYTSALRAYHKVIELDANKASHCRTRIGYIHSLLTQYKEAISVFYEVLESDPASLLALQGVAETWMRIAKKKVLANMYGSARDCAQQAINFITKAILNHKQFSCLWKIYGDTLMFITTLPNKYSYVIMNPSFNDSKDSWVKKEKIEIYPQAIACYSYIAKQKQIFASYDLASAYVAFYRESKKKPHFQVAFNLTIACIKSKPQLWQNWNLLGKLYWNIDKYSSAQHCFIKALLATRKWSVAKIWCNLGTLYLKLKQFKLSNYCYWRGQCTLPSYPHSWIGQGLIAENIREEEAMDLFRHASRLGYHRESALGYADWVCRTIKNSNQIKDSEYKYVIEALYAIPYAIDLIEWFSCFEPENAFACTVLGILQERVGLLQAAFRSYEKALMYVNNDKRNIALLNMGRILLRLNKYDEAIIKYKEITEASLDSACGLALALYKNGLYEESYSAYDTALHWLSNDDIEKSDILVAMASIMYKFKGPDDAKTLLFHSIQISQKKPTAYSLFSICSLGLLHSDQSLSKLAMSELQKYEKDNDFSFDVGFLKSYILFTENSADAAIRSISESLHDHPSNALLWFCMAQYCLRATTPKAISASTCAQRALCSARNFKASGSQAKMIATASIAERISGNKTKAFTLAKDGLHMYPENAEIWAALLSSILANNINVGNKDWLVTVAGYVRRHLEISRPLSRWVGLVEKSRCK